VIIQKITFSKIPKCFSISERPDIIPTAVSIVSSPCEKASNSLAVVYDILPLGQERGLATVCVQVHKILFYL